MKTVADLNSLIPVIIETLEKSEHSIGISDRYGDEYNDNYYCYDEDSWNIELEYRCCGKWSDDDGDYWNPPTSDLIKAWGKVTGLAASYYDEKTDEFVEFSEEELSELRRAIIDVLRNIE